MRVTGVEGEMDRRRQIIKEILKKDIDTNIRGNEAIKYVLVNIRYWKYVYYENRNKKLKSNCFYFFIDIKLRVLYLYVKRL